MSNQCQMNQTKYTPPNYSSNYSANDLARIAAFLPGVTSELPPSQRFQTPKKDFTYMGIDPCISYGNYGDEANCSTLARSYGNYSQANTICSKQPTGYRYIKGSLLDNY